MAKLIIISYNARNVPICTEYGDTKVNDDIKERVARLSKNKMCSRIIVGGELAFERRK